MAARFEIQDSLIRGVKIIHRRPVGDDRGYLERMFCADEFRLLLGGKFISQINHSLTSREGAVRGMHFQFPPHAEIKFVSCLRGEIFDVAVDLRRHSPTFLQWHGERLSAANHRTLVVPEGFAHGFQTLTDDCELLYLHTAAWQPAFEGAVNACDPKLGIRWPKSVTELSARDAAHPWIEENFSGVDL